MSCRIPSDEQCHDAETGTAHSAVPNIAKATYKAYGVTSGLSASDFPISLPSRSAQP